MPVPAQIQSLAWECLYFRVGMAFKKDAEDLDGMGTGGEKESGDNLLGGPQQPPWHLLCPLFQMPFPPLPMTFPHPLLPQNNIAVLQSFYQMTTHSHTALMHVYSQTCS